MYENVEKESPIYDVYKYISEMRAKLLYSNRFFIDKSFLAHLKCILSEAEETVGPKRLFFRARRYQRENIDPSKLGTAFEGYNEEDSFVNLNSTWPASQRMNPQGIQVLYMSTDVRTAITELHPYYNGIYSVATIKVKEKLRIANLSLSQSMLDDNFTRLLAIYVQEWISQGSADKDYVFPQYVAAYCHHLGYDGIAYRSKYSTREDARKKKGTNYTIFNYEKCEVISSKLYEVDKVSVQLSTLESKQLLTSTSV